MKKVKVVVQALANCTLAKKPKFIPKPPKRRTKFGPGRRGDRSNKNPRTRAVASVGDGAEVSPAASAPS